MKRHARILAGTAVGLLMTAAPLSYAFAQTPAAVGAAPAAVRLPGPAAESTTRPLLLAQAEPDDEESEEEKAKRRQRREAPADADNAERPADEPALREAAPEPETKPATQPETTPPAESAPREEPEPEAAPQAEPESEPQAEPQPEPDEPAAQPEASQPEDRQAADGPSEVAPSEEAQPEPQQAPPEQPQSEQPAQSEPPADAGEQAEPDEGEAPADATPEDAPRPDPAPQVAPEDNAPEPEPRPQAPAADGDAETPDTAPDQQSGGGDSQSETVRPETVQPGTGQDGGQPEAAKPEGEQPAATGGETPPEGAAPVLDSQKEQQDSGTAGEDEQPGEDAAGQAAQPSGETGQPAEAAPPPANDAAAQEEARPVELQPVTQEEGRRIERQPDDRRQERPERAEVVREIGDRIVIRIDNTIIVESNDRPRIARGARDVYYEELPRGRTREVIVRENGVRVVTIRDRYGDVIRRSRITPDGRETVLVYVSEDDYERVRDWRDPGRDLPPMRLTIPVNEYILDAGRVDDTDAYYDFLDQPPVERVERLYSIDEVKRSARIRDKTRRVDLDTITFEFGSASIAESEIARLEGVAQAMERLLEENPAETFLIEGHTDAVGSNIANLALSDRRAEAVADALTNVFAIPPENLATQGYGEQYLKIRTEEPERENRRVAIRRITPLVAPVAAAQ